MANPRLEEEKEQIISPWLKARAIKRQIRLSNRS
jgi:hypothetical protein